MISLMAGFLFFSTLIAIMAWALQSVLFKSSNGNVSRALSFLLFCGKNLLTCLVLFVTLRYLNLSPIWFAVGCLISLASAVGFFLLKQTKQSDR